MAGSRVRQVEPKHMNLPLSDKYKRSIKQIYRPPGKHLRGLDDMKLAFQKQIFISH
jgi:hypothetical protein